MLGSPVVAAQIDSAELSLGRPLADLRLVARADRARVDLGDLRLDGDLRASASARALGDGALTVDEAAIEATGVEARLARRRARPAIVVPRATLTGRSDRVELARPSLRDFDVALSVPRAELRDARSLNAIVPPRSRIRIESGRAVATVRASARAREVTGRATVRASGLSVRVDDAVLSGDVTIVAALRGDDPGRSAFDVSGSRVTMRGVRATGATETRGWRGELTLARAMARLDEPRLSARLRLVGDDASPLLAIAASDAIPEPFLELVRAPELRASADLCLARRLVSLENIAARGGDTSMRGSFVQRGDERAGALVVEKGPLSAGLELEDDGSSVELFGLDEWLRGEAAEARALESRPPPAADRAKGERCPPRR